MLSTSQSLTAFSFVKFVINFLSGERLKIEVDPSTYLRTKKKVDVNKIKREAPLITQIMEEEK